MDSVEQNWHDEIVPRYLREGLVKSVPRLHTSQIPPVEMFSLAQKATVPRCFEFEFADHI